MRLFLPVLASSLLVLACKSSDPAPPPAPATSARAAPSASAAAPVSTTTAVASTAPTASAAPPTSASAAVAEAADTPPPSPEEWASAEEINVTGSSALHCETTRLREWVRVLCNQPNDAGGTPTAVKLKKAEVLLPGLVSDHHKNVKTQGESGMAMLVTKYVEGVDVEAQFSWTDQEKLLVLWWPAGKPEPRLLGAFK